ncbi:MAG: SDR family NAD(P)-dependent oxidoreductase [Woeseiaceae bacterium]|nr:SDR family NAD(P)-dependent oxidoreductase [Woeseiaceae bacterium]
MLESLKQPYRAAVIGASGGIGRAFTERLAADPAASQVFAFSRTPVDSSHDKLVTAALELGDESSIEKAARLVDGELDLVIVATGILHDGDSLQPEKAMRDISAGNMRDVLAINTIGPALVAKHFLPILRREHKTVFAALSARVGSIGDNRLGGWVSYRASKAALNMTLRTLAIEHARRFPDSVIAGLHPGTVQTPLSDPFSSRVPDEKLFSPAQSVDYLLEVIDGLTADDSGGVFAWDAERIPE